MQIAISQKILEHFEYHWFYGIQKTSIKEQSLGAELSLLMDKASEIQEMELNVQSLMKLNNIIQWIYWVFNIHDFRKSYYIVAAYQASQLYAEQVLSLEPSRQIDAQKKGWFYASIETPLNYFNELMEILLIANSIELSEPLIQAVIVRNELSDMEKEQAASEAKSKEILFNVTDEMQIHLRVLEINYPTGSELCLHDITVKYRKMALKTHPDRNKAPDASELFIKINQAYEKLLKIIKRLYFKPPSQGEVSSFFEDDSLSALFTAFEESFEECNKILEQGNKILEQGNKILEQGNKILEQGNIILEECDKHLKECDKHLEECTEMVKQCRRDQAEIKEICEENKKKCENLNELIKTYFQQNKKNKQSVEDLNRREDLIIERSNAEKAESEQANAPKI